MRIDTLCPVVVLVADHLRSDFVTSYVQIQLYITTGLFCHAENGLGLNLDRPQRFSCFQFPPLLPMRSEGRRTNLEC